MAPRRPRSPPRYTFVSVRATFVAVGVLMGAFVVVWYVVRCAKALNFLVRREPYPDAGTWLW